MTREIPEDIMRSAERVYAKLGRGSNPDTDTIARAIMEERMRCENAVLLAGLEAPIPDTLLAAIRNRP